MTAPAPLFTFDNSYARLPERLFARVAPTPVRRPVLLRLNEALARELGLDPSLLAGPEGVAVLAGNQVPAGAASLAMGYAGHQFGHFVPRLGDGRALLLGELVGDGGQRRDLQWKGSGRTPYSRGGDGRAALGPVLREYIVAEAMHALGIPTTRALAAVATGEPVYRDSVLPGAVLLRVASSHLRVGTFEFAAANDDVDGVRALADLAIERHDPQARQAAQPYAALLEGVIARQAQLVARWLLVGFVHGVMNTDNTTISGETIDYGPCAFLDEYHPGAVWSSIDHQGRYAYGNQPRILHWNLTRLAETLLPLLDSDEERAVARAQQALATFAPAVEATYQEGLRRKLCLASARPGDETLGAELLAAMAAGGADFTLTFRRLADAAVDPGAEGALAGLFRQDAQAALAAWLVRFRARLAEEQAPAAERAAAARAASPAFIPRNHRVEEAIAAATVRGDLGPFHELVEVLSRPYEEQPGRERYQEPPADEERVTRTFCGT